MKVLKEDNPFYGKKGTKVDDRLLDLIPPSHHSLFEEQKKNKIDPELKELMDRYTIRYNPFAARAGWDIPNPQPMEAQEGNEVYLEEDNDDNNEYDWDRYFEDDPEVHENEDIEPF